MSFLISILPIFIYLGLLIYFDTFSVIRTKRLVYLILWGVLDCILIYLLSRTFLLGQGVVPLLEEVLKFSAAVYLLLKNRFVFFTDTAIYGASIGAGFSLAENLVYTLSFQDLQFSELIYRGLATSFMHMGMTAMASVLLLFLVKGNFAAETRRNPLLWAPVAIFPSVLLHYLHNSFYIPPLVSLFVVILVIAVAFLLLFAYNESQTHKWLDVSIYNDVRLLSSIKKGELSQTAAGKYLLSVKSQFRPEVFFDMLVYLQLYLELSLLSKRNLLLIESGLDIPQEDVEQVRGMIREFNILKRNIGKLGVYTLSPVVDSKVVDRMVDTFVRRYV